MPSNLFNKAVECLEKDSAEKDEAYMDLLRKYERREDSIRTITKQLCDTRDEIERMKSSDWMYTLSELDALRRENQVLHDRLNSIRDLT